MKEMKENLRNLLIALENHKNHNTFMVIGMDGFVDEIIHVVDKRQNLDQYTRIPTLDAFGNRISCAAGLSTNLEIVPVQTKLGGNGPILSNALLSYGTKVTYIGALGTPDIHPAFGDMANKMEKVYSLCEPARSEALEFDDGKLMLNMVTPFNNITWESVKSAIGNAGDIESLFSKCDLVGFGNWTAISHMNSIWRGLLEEVFPLMSDSITKEKPFAFFDLADPEKRSYEDIIAAIELIKKFEEKFRVILGLNEKELNLIADALDVVSTGRNNLREKVMETYSAMGIYGLVVHPLKEACCCIEGEYFQVEGPYCEKPILTTGAGDNFNAGFCLGLVLKLSAVNALTLGVCSSGYYVRNAKAPTYTEIMDFVKQLL